MNYQQNKENAGQNMSEDGDGRKTVGTVEENMIQYYSP